MKAHIITSYKKIVPTKSDLLVNIVDLERFLTDLDNKPFWFDLDELTTTIIDYFDSGAYFFIDNDEIFEDAGYKIEIVNLDELVNHFSYLLPKKEINFCCKEINTPYCPICGTKLK